MISVRCIVAVSCLVGPDEEVHDSTEFDTGPWLEGRLGILDLTYFKYRRFALIDENGGYFVSRLKDRSNPVITDELRE